MAVLSASKQRPMKPIHGGNIPTYSFPLAGYTNFGSGSTAHTVYKGSIVVCDVSDTDGYGRAAPATGTTAAASGDMFLGVALEEVDVTSSDTSDGAKSVTCAVNCIVGFAVGSLAVTDLGADIYASDDDTVTSTSTNNFKIGKLVDVDATYAWVDISPYWLTAI